MKRYFRYMAGAMAVVFAMASCSLLQEEKTDIGEAPTAEQLKFEFTYDVENPNLVHFTNASEVGFKAVWDFGNGTSGEGDQVTGAFPIEGDYTVKMLLLSEGGHNSIEKVVNIAQTNALMLNTPTYNNLTGGAEQLEGKTWVLDQTVFGHMGVGPEFDPESGDEVFDPVWWEAPPGDKEGLGLYDDQITFKLDGFNFIYETNGAVFSNGAHAESIGGNTSGEDQAVPFTYEGAMNWSLKESADGRKYITISNGGHIGFYTGSSTYEILKLEENELYIRNIDGNGGTAWYQRLIPLGYEHPVEVPDYKVEDIYSDFEGNSNITWFTDEVTSFTAGYDNPATFGINTSEKVAKYVRGDNFEWVNLQIQKDYKFDLTTRNKFKMKVFLPSYNAYNQESGLARKVELKLQNSDMGGIAYQSQAVATQDSLALDQWIELEFDFSEEAARKDFDKIIIQFGGEGHFEPGTFFFDDIELL